MPFYIAICDDDASDSKVLSSCVRAACTELGLYAQTDIFPSGEDFLDAHRIHPYDIVFMDIYMNGINGMEAAWDAVHKHPCQLVFTTVSKEYALEAFSINAAHYLLKPLTEISVREAVERCLARLPRKPSKVLEIKTSRGVIPLSMDSIIYIEVLNNICTIHTKKKSLQTYMSLASLFELLDHTYFIRAQRSYVVNMYFIESFFFDRIILQNGQEITLSRINRAELKNQYQQFLFNLARENDT